jgi:hypothetical protein
MLIIYNIKHSPYKILFIAILIQITLITSLFLAADEAMAMMIKNNQPIQSDKAIQSDPCTSMATVYSCKIDPSQQVAKRCAEGNTFMYINGIPSCVKTKRCAEGNTFMYINGIPRCISNKTELSISQPQSIICLDKNFHVENFVDSHGNPQQRCVSNYTA